MRFSNQDSEEMKGDYLGLNSIMLLVYCCTVGLHQFEPTPNCSPITNEITFRET